MVLFGGIERLRIENGCDDFLSQRRLRIVLGLPRIAGLDRGLGMESAIDLALKAGTLMVERHGTADVIPDLKEIQDRFGL